MYLVMHHWLHTPVGVINSATPCIFIDPHTPCGINVHEDILTPNYSANQTTNYRLRATLNEAVTTKVGLAPEVATG